MNYVSMEMVPPNVPGIENKILINLHITKVQYLVPRHIYLDLNIRFSLNSTDSKIYVG